MHPILQNPDSYCSETGGAWYVLGKKYHESYRQAPSVNGTEQRLMERSGGPQCHVHLWKQVKKAWLAAYSPQKILAKEECDRLLTELPQDPITKLKEKATKLLPVSLK